MAAIENLDLHQLHFGTARELLECVGMMPSRRGIASGSSACKKAQRDHASACTS
jgi:hypothetical protein